MNKATKKHVLPRPPKKLTQSFIKEQLDYNQLSNGQQINDYTDQLDSTFLDQNLSQRGANLHSGLVASQLKLSNITIVGGGIPGRPDSRQENEDLISSNNSLLDIDKQENNEQIFQHHGSIDNPNLPTQWNNIKYKK